MAAAAGAVGSTRQSQAIYEKGGRFPDAAYLSAVAAAGVDVRYVITGERSYTPPPALSAEEQRLVALFRLADASVRKAVVGALAVGEAPAVAKAQSVAPLPAPAAKTIKRGGITVHVAGGIGQQVEGGIHSPQTFNMGGARGRKPKDG